jgi:hypothetical protein
MRIRLAFLAVFVSFASTLQGQQPAAPPAAAAAPAAEPRIIVYKIELVPTGFMFAMNEPVLEGDTWIFRSLPERTEMKLPKVKVKSVARWSTDYSKEVVWRVELAGSAGMHLARNEPVKKGKNWVAHTWKNNTLVSVPETDVVKITRLTGAEAFKAEQLALGLIVLEGESTAPGFKGGNGRACRRVQSADWVRRQLDVPGQARRDRRLRSVRRDGRQAGRHADGPDPALTAFRHSWRHTIAPAGDGGFLPASSCPRA